MRKLIIGSNLRDKRTMEWVGESTVDNHGNIERTADIPADVYDEMALYIKLGVEDGVIENEGERYEWTIIDK